MLKVLEAVSWAIKNEEVIQRGFSAIAAGLPQLLAEHFQEALETIRAFAKCQASATTSLEAIKCLSLAADHLCSSQAEKIAPGSHFFNILKYLADSVWDQRKDVRGAALETLFQILCRHTSSVDESGWELVLTDIIETLFKGLQDQLKPGGAEQVAADAAASLYIAALKALTRLLEASLSCWSPGIVTRALAPLTQAVRQESEAAQNAAMANAARECLRALAARASAESGVQEASISAIQAAAKDL